DRARRAGEEALRRGADARARAEWERERVMRGMPLSIVHPGAEHRIDRLQPAYSWTLAVGPAGGDRHIGVLLPGDPPAPPPPAASPPGTDWLPPDQLDAALQALLDQPAGILGLRAADGPREVLQWALRLLPLAASGNTSLSFAVAPGAGP